MRAATSPLYLLLCPQLFPRSHSDLRCRQRLPSASLRHSMPPRKKQRGVAAADSCAADAVGTSSSASSAAAIPVSRSHSLRLNPPQPHEKLHRHALESIFGLLSFDELRLAMFVSLDWLSAVSSMRGLEKGKSVKPDVYGDLPTLPQMLSSRLARHVGQLGSGLTME